MAKQLLILDLDETLVYADEKPLDRPPDFRVGTFYVYRRPCLSQFLDSVGEWFDLAVWSSASGSYVHGIVENLFGTTNSLCFVWSSNQCTRRYHPEMQEHFFAKNLGKVRKLGYSLERVLMVDDSPEKLAQHYGNHIGDHAFTGDLEDTELNDILPFLNSLRTTENLRSVEKRFWHRPGH